MFRNWKAIIIVMILALCSCHHNEPDPDSRKARKTVIMYMVAENSLSSFLNSDLYEILAAKDSIPLDCNLVVYVDGLQMPVCYTYSRQTGKSEWKTYPEQDSCDSLVFRNTLADIISHFPAKNYGLIMWSHGSGWLPDPSHVYDSSNQSPRRTIGIDNNTNATTNKGSELEIPVMKRMLEQLGVQWEYIFFDACFMQCVEVDYELRNVCDHVIASPAEIPGEGAPYHLIMSSLFKDTDAPASIAKIYYENNIEKTYSGGVKGGLIISVSNSNEMDNLAALMKGHITTLFADKREFNLYNTQYYCKYNIYSVWKPEYYDLGSAMNQLLTSPVDYQALVNQLNQTYPVNLHTQYWLSEFFTGQQGIVFDSDHLASVSIFLPHSKYASKPYTQALHDYEWYHAAGWDETGW